jgi:serine/threonine protein kinase
MRLVGKTIGHYKIVDVLGAGGMATVYRAQQTNIEREVAIKVMASAFAQQADFVERFKREAELFAKLEHPHILPIYDYGEQSNNLYLVLRLMEGGSLESQVRKRTMTLEQVAKIMQQIGNALDHAHSKQVIHRDLKPNNVLLDKFGNAYLMDFGIAKILSGSRLTATGTLLGTPAYMAPEQWKLDPIDGRADIYSLGLMLYELLTGDLPFAGETPFQFMYAHLHEAVPPISKKGLPAELDEVIMRSTDKNPDNRYNTATEMANALTEAVRRAGLHNQEVGGHGPRLQDRLGKIFVALERSDSGLYAVPKLEDFVKQAYQHTTAVSKHPSQIDDILGTIETKPSTQSYDTSQMKDLLSQGRVSQASMGVSAQPIPLPPKLEAMLGQSSGLLVIGVGANSAAEQAGIHIGDILVTVAGHHIRNQDDLKNALNDEDIGRMVRVQIVRTGELQIIEVIPGQR